MFTDAQLLYLTEVLGTDPAHYRSAGPGADVATEVADVAHVLVWTPVLTPPERDLLAKILASVELTTFGHVEGADPGPCRHLLRFDGEEAGRRSGAAGGVEWRFPDLKSMLGAGPEVGRRKREVWTVLQEFRRNL